MRFPCIYHINFNQKISGFREKKSIFFSKTANFLSNRAILYVMKANKEIKSSVFADLFCDDEKDGKKNFLSLYNAIHGTNLTLEGTRLERKRIPQSLYKTFDSDISVLVNGRLFILAEHQSTQNENIPLRCLEYYVHLLYGIVPARARYKKALFKIPAPEFYVFYNGAVEQEPERTLRLSDAFIEPQADPLCEVKVKFLNIGQGRAIAPKNAGENLRVVQNCAILRQYCEFMEIVARRRAALRPNPTDDELLDCYEKAIDEAISNGVLSDYLTRKSTEVRNMFFGEYDYDTDIEVAKEEAYEQKAVETARNMLNLNVGSVEQIAQITGLPLGQVLDLQKELSSTPAQK